MKKRLISMLLVICMVLSLMPGFTVAVSAAEGDLPTTLSVEPSDINNIPAAIDLYQSSSSSSGGGWPGMGGGWPGMGGGTTTTSTAYDLYLPGNTDVANCFLSWEGGLNATMDGKSYASGELPVPAVGETKTITFNNGTGKTFEVTTYQGSETMKTMFIEIDESKGTIDDMNNDPDHETECTGIIFIDGEEHELDTMKGRGNATWSQARQKRPYNITLGKKVESILGIEMPDKSKKFSLLANIADRSLLRNKVGFDIAYEMGIGLDSESVDLWMNGKYIGVYLVTPKNDTFVTDGGYAVENDNYKEPSIAEGGDPSFELEGLTTARQPMSAHEHNRITVKAIGDDLLPNGETEEELTRVAGEIQSWMQDMWDAIRSENGYNDKGKYYTEYVDITSWASMYLMQEYAKGYDANAGSLLFYRDGTTDADKMFAGPLWDLDNALGSTQVNSLLGNQVDQTDANGWFMSKLGDGKTSIYKTIGQHEDFMDEVYRVYNEYKHLFDNAPAQVEALAEEIADSAAMNFKKVTQETYNTVNYSRETVKSAGTEYEQTYKATNNWEDYVDNLVTFTTIRSKFLSDNIPEVTVCEHVYESVVTEPTCIEGGFTTYTCSICGNSYIGDKTDALGHNYQDGACSVCGEEEKTAYVATFVCDENSSVTVYESKDLNGPSVENAEFGYARNGDTGEIDMSGDGQVNFIVNVAEGYKLESVTAEPAGNYKNLKDPAELEIENGYRVTKIKGDLTITVKTVKEGGLESIDFTDSASADRFEVINQASTAIREGEGLYLVTTTDAFEPCNNQISTFNPKDVVKVPVGGDWTATMKFDFSQASAQNGYYQFFGFYAAEGDDYQNLAGIRGGDQAMQNFLRVNGTVTADSADLNSSPGLASNGTYWWRIVKEGTTYTCYRSADGETFTEMFSYADTGIEADSLIIDAYTGMTTGYEFIVESLSFEGGEGGSVTPNPDPEPEPDPEPSGELPENLSVEPSETNNIPAAIDLYQTSSSSGGGWPGWGGGGWPGMGGGTTTTSSAYDLYLPGNTDVANCFFSWEGGLKATVDGQSYASGELPVPAVGETKNITFNNGTEKTFEVTTYQGSETMKTIFIEIDESKGTIADMNGDPDHETECTGIIFIDGEEHELDAMKGRGNATWSQARQKRPYNITLGKKVESILGIEMPDKSKKFSLLANIADRSLLRNKVGYDIAYEMGIGLDSESVDLWMNGEYYGTYLVTAKNDSFVTDDGYAVENDNYKEPSIAEGGDPSFELEGLLGVQNSWGSVAAHEHNRITVKAIGDNLLPNGETEEELTRVSGEIQDWMQDMWDAIRSEDGYNDKGKYYTDYVDITTWASMYLIQEYAKGYDANAGSLLFYRDGTTDEDKMFAGPLWDLDNALGSTQVNSLLGNQVDQTDANGWFMSKLGDGKTSIFKTIGQHEDFMDEVYRVYNEYKHLFDNAPAQVEAFAEAIADSAAMNFKKVTQETYNTVNYSRETVKSAGTEYEQTYKATNNWEDYVDNLVTFTTVRSKFLSDNIPEVTVCKHEYESVVTEPTCEEGGFTTFTCSICGNSYIGDKTDALGHNYQDGACSVCGKEEKTAYVATFVCDENSSVTVYESKDLNGPSVENAEFGYARNGDTGEIDMSGDGQVNFIVNVAKGYKLESVTAEPAGNYKNLKDPAELEIENGYRVTKIKGDLTITVKTVKEGGLESIDFTDPASESRMEIINQESTGIRPGEGLYLITTADAFEPCNGRISTFVPKDVVKVPVSGDWTATMEFDFDPAGAANGYYQFFGFYASEGEDFNKLAGIRGGDGAMQNFLRTDADTIEADNNNSTPGLATAGTYWWRIVKEGDTYTCYRSEDGETFSEMFTYADTGIEADALVIDAYTGMTEGYTFLVKSIEFEGGQSGPAIVKPEVASISVDGEALEGFDPAVRVYNVEVPKTSTNVPVITVEAGNAGTDIAIEQLEGPFGTATITATAGSRTLVYTVSFNYGPEDDYFADGDMNDNWTILNEVKDPTEERPWTYYRFEEGVGLVLPTQKGSIYMAKQADPQGPWTNVFLMPAQGDWEIITKSFYPELPRDIYQQTQILGWQDEDHYIRINCQYNAQRNLRVEPANEVGSNRFDILNVTYATPNEDNTATLYYKMTKTGTTYTVAYSTDCKTWVDGGTVENLNYIDPKFGLFATQDDPNDNYMELSFEYVAVTSRNGEVLKTDEEVLLWAAQNAADYMAESLPAATTEDLVVKAPHGYSVEFVSSNPDVIAADGTVTPAAADATVEVSIKVTEGDTVATSETVTIKVKGTGAGECEHDYEEAVTEPTCTEGGYTTYTCSKCGDTYKGNETDALGHKYDKVVTEATCTEGGYTTYTCSVCSDSYKDDETDALGHKYDKVVTEPTCTEGGYTTFTCSVCKDTYKGEEVAATGHKYEEKVTAPTCTEGGYTTFTCSVCKDTYKGKEVAATGHKYEEKVTAPTCTEGGYTTFTCSVCKDTYKGEEVAAAGHKWDEGKVTTEATEKVEGVKTFTCSVCQETKTETIPVVECPSKDFSDVPAFGNWAHEGIDYAVENKLMEGTGNGLFNPKGTLTRAELVTILYRAKGEPEVEFKGVFTDVADNKWYSDAIEWAAEAKIVEGIGDGKFDPSGLITREQIATMLYRYAGEPNVEGNLESFTDAASVSKFAQKAMIWATANEIITGVSEGGVVTLAPKADATREQIAAIVMRYLELEKK